MVVLMALTPDHYLPISRKAKTRSDRLGITRELIQRSWRTLEIRMPQALA